MKWFTPTPKYSLRKRGDEWYQAHGELSAYHGDTSLVWGFTLFEVVVVIALSTVIGFGVFLFFNQEGRVMRVRNAERKADINVVVSAVRENMFDNDGVFACGSGPLPATSTRMSDAGGYHIAPCLVPLYLFLLPYDPTASGAHFASSTDYDTGYHILWNATTGLVTVEAPFAEAGEVVRVTR